MAVLTDLTDKRVFIRCLGRVVNDLLKSEEKEEEAFLLFMDDDDEVDVIDSGRSGCLSMILLTVGVIGAVMALLLII